MGSSDGQRWPSTHSLPLPFTIRHPCPQGTTDKARKQVLCSWVLAPQVLDMHLDTEVWDQKKIKGNDDFSTQFTTVKIQTSFECCFKFGLLPLLLKTGSVFLCTFTALCTVGKACSSDDLWCPPLFLKPPELKRERPSFVFLQPKSSWWMGCILSNCGLTPLISYLFSECHILRWCLSRVNTTREMKIFSDIQINATLWIFLNSLFLEEIIKVWFPHGFFLKKKNLYSNTETKVRVIDLPSNFFYQLARSWVS